MMMQEIGDNTMKFGNHNAGEPRSLFDGEQYRIRFPNGYSASIIRHQHSHGGPEGLWEVAVLHGNRIVYDTPVTDDVLGHLDTAQVADALTLIEHLPDRASLPDNW